MGRQVKHYLLATLAAALAGCAGSMRYVDPELHPYVYQIETEYGVQFNGKVVYANIMPKAAGICKVWYDYSKMTYIRLIEIDRNYFNQLTSIGKEQLMLHELGHCMLGLQHNNNLKEDGCPESAMYYSAFGHTHCYVNQRSYYIEEVRSSWYEKIKRHSGTFK